MVNRSQIHQRYGCPPLVQDHLKHLALIRLIWQLSLWLVSQLSRASWKWRHYIQGWKSFPSHLTPLWALAPWPSFRSSNGSLLPQSPCTCCSPTQNTLPSFPRVIGRQPLPISAPGPPVQRSLVWPLDLWVSFMDWPFPSDYFSDLLRICSDGSVPGYPTSLPRMSPAPSPGRGSGDPLKNH